MICLHYDTVFDDVIFGLHFVITIILIVFVFVIFPIDSQWDSIVVGGKTVVLVIIFASTIDMVVIIISYS